MVKQGSSSIRNRSNARPEFQSAKRNVVDEDAAATPSNNSLTGRLLTFLVKIRPYVLIVSKICGSIFLGLLCASSMWNDRSAVILFMVTVLSVFLFLILVFRSIHSQRDPALLHLPTIHNADGTTMRQDAISVFEHDKRFATYYSSELPAFAIATAWFYVWSHWTTVMVIFAMYVGHRVVNHPLFRIHVWREKHSADLARPFGTAPLFNHDDSPVALLEGLQMFDAAINLAPPDQLLIVDASAPWCAACRTAEPAFEELARSFPICSFLTIDVDVSRDVAQQLEISSIPSFFFFKDAKRVDVIRGASPDALRAAVERHMKSI